MKESQLQSKFIQAIEANGGYVVKVIAASKSGVPDLLCCIRGRFVGIELKAPGKLNELKPLQKYNIELIKKSGGVALALDSLDSLKEALCQLHLWNIK